jgi:hypothetical protein
MWTNNGADFIVATEKGLKWDWHKKQKHIRQNTHHTCQLEKTFVRQGPADRSQGEGGVSHHVDWQETSGSHGSHMDWKSETSWPCCLLQGPALESLKGPLSSNVCEQSPAPGMLMPCHPDQSWSMSVQVHTLLLAGSLAYPSTLPGSHTGNTEA